MTWSYKSAPAQIVARMQICGLVCALEVPHYRLVSRALGLRHSAEYAPWSVAVDHMIEVYRYLQLRPSQDCADRWATFVRGRIVDPTLGNNTQLALDSQQASEGAGRMDIQARLLRPLLASLSNEFNDTGARLQAQGIFQVRDFTFSKEFSKESNGQFCF